MIALTKRAKVGTIEYKTIQLHGNKTIQFGGWGKERDARKIGTQDFQDSFSVLFLNLVMRTDVLISSAHQLSPDSILLEYISFQSLVSHGSDNNICATRSAYPFFWAEGNVWHSFQPGFSVPPFVQALPPSRNATFLLLHPSRSYWSARFSWQSALPSPLLGPLFLRLFQAWGKSCALITSPRPFLGT